MSLFNKKAHSKRELLEIMLIQQKQIERLENEVISLKKEVEIKNKKIEEISILVEVTNKLIQVTKVIEKNFSSTK